MFGPEILALLIPFGLVVVLPIVTILTHHQRKMAELYQKQSNQLPNPEIMALRQEVRELKELIHQQAIMMDAITPRVEERTHVGQLQ